METQRIPQPRPVPVLGNVPDIDTTIPVQSMVLLGRKYGPLYRLELPGNPLLLVSSHALVDELCDERRFSKYLLKPLKHLRPLAGDGLFTAETHEPNWAKAHGLLLPAFGAPAMRGYFDAMLDVAEQLVTKWERLGPDVDLDVADNMTRLTLDTIALCGFGYRFNSFYQREMHPFVDAMVRCLAEASARGRRIPLQTKLMRGTQRQFDADVAYMNEVVDTVIAERRAHPQAGGRDLLSLMLEGRDPATGEGLSDVNIRYQIVTFLIAGHETTSGLLSFAIHALLRSPAVLARATDEVLRVLGADPARAPRFEDLHRLTYLDQILRETLRLWPTAPAFGLTPKEDTVIGGRYPVKKDAALLVLSPLLHRDPAVWGPDPEAFDPDRFAPDRIGAIPVNAWKPFGNGQRACIGRQFAMQEAMLVLAMVLRRFVLVPKPGYDLEVKETLTLKPEGFTVRARVRPRSPVEVAATPAVAGTPRPAPVAVAQHGTPLLVLFGSNSGSSEAFARRIAADAATQGYAATAAPMDAYVGRLPTAGAVVIVTASYNGRPPDNARRFCEWLDTLAPSALAGVRYAVLGCGHRDWASTYQAVPRRVDEALAQAGATRLCARGETDARGDFFGEFERWSAPVWDTLADAFDVSVVDAPFTPQLAIEPVDTTHPVVAAHGLRTLEVLENRELVDLGSPLGRSKRHLAFRLPEGHGYRAGDHLAILPRNVPAQVERVLRRFQLDGDAHVIVRQTREARSLLPVDRAVTLRTLLGQYVELAAPATRRDVELLARHTECPPEKKQLLARATDGVYEELVLAKRVSLLDLLEQFPACTLPFHVFLELVPPMKPRRYSISSSPRVDPARCTITVAVVEAPAWSGHGRFLGACSNFLRDLAPGDAVAAAVVEHPIFRLPDDPATPVVLVGAGTGIAPLRGFLEERAALADQGAALGPALLFFGCDHADVDFLYRDELAAWEARGIVKVFPAFSAQAADGVSYVQHRLAAERTTVLPLLAAGARVYVCGDGRHMAPAVRETFGRLWREANGGSEEDAAAWLRALDEAGRYVTDVFA